MTRLVQRTVDLDASRTPAGATPSTPIATPLYWPALIFALTFPTLLSYLDFIAFSSGGGEPNPAQQLVYSGGKVLQFLFPLICFFLVYRRLPRAAAPTLRGLGFGLGFGVLVASGVVVLYYAFLKNSVLLASTAVQLRQKLEEFGVASPLGFALFAFFVIVLHSLLEEYYWRWFVFGWLRKRVSLLPAMIISGLGFMGHHVIILWVYFPDQLLTAVIPFSLCVAVGGAIWAWLYERSGSLYAPWLSHLLVDASLFMVGYDLYFGG